jgi:hypothetical protein
VAATRSSKRSRKDARGRFRPGHRRLLDRIWIPGRDGLHALESGARDVYDLSPVHSDVLDEQYEWRVTVNVPGYDVKIDLRIEIEEFTVNVIADNWSGPAMKHTYGNNRLCMWHPEDPEERKWRRQDGLLKLIDSAVMHLFREFYYRETGEWLGEEAPHAGAKVEDRSLPRAA